MVLISPNSFSSFFPHRHLLPDHLLYYRTLAPQLTCFYDAPDCDPSQFQRFILSPWAFSFQIRFFVIFMMHIQVFNNSNIIIFINRKKTSSCLYLFHLSLVMCGKPFIIAIIILKNKHLFLRSYSFGKEFFKKITLQWTYLFCLNGFIPYFEIKN